MPGPQGRSAPALSAPADALELFRPPAAVRATEGFQLRAAAQTTAVVAVDGQVQRVVEGRPTRLRAASRTGA